VVLVDGAAALYVDRGGSSLQVLPPADADPAVRDAALRALGDLVADGRVRELVIGKVDGEAVGSSRFREALLAAGFVAGYRGYALRATSATPVERTYPRSGPVGPSPGPVRPTR